MMMARKRRKGEQPVVHQPIGWSEDCVIAHMIRRGDNWFRAWFVQINVRGLDRLGTRLGISSDRLEALWRGAIATDQELEALATPFNTDATTLCASIDYAHSLNGAVSHGS